MFPFALVLLFSSINAQFYAQQQFNNYNPWSWGQGSQLNQRSSVRGTLFADDSSPLPFGSQIVVTLADVSLQDVAARPLNTVVLSGSYRFPIPFEVPYSLAQVQSEATFAQQYALQVRIEKDGQLLYINDQRVAVQLNPPPVNPINIVLKRVNSPSGPGGIFTTRPPIINGLYGCLQAPEVGPCKAVIPQFYFHSQSRSCQVFYWGGCAGNANRFGSREECERTCSNYQRHVVTNNVKQRWMNRP